MFKSVKLEVLFHVKSSEPKHQLLFDSSKKVLIFPQKLNFFKWVICAFKSQIIPSYFSFVRWILFLEVFT